MAAWADRGIARVLALADTREGLPRPDAVRATLAAMRLAADRPRIAWQAQAREARRLNEAGRIAYWSQENAAEALRLQTKAFTSNPLDSEIAGNLAFFRMRQQPAQVEGARQLALHALALPDARYPAGRVQDWTTLAITNALLGREAEARQAWLVSLAVAPDPRRQRSAALRSREIYGPRLGPSVEAALRRSADIGTAGGEAISERDADTATRSARSGP